MSELYIKQELFKTVEALDALIFEVDGVILDVSDSFGAVVSAAVQHYAAHVLKLQADEPFVTPDEAQIIKFAGGFEHFGDQANAAVALLCAKKAKTGLTTTGELRAAEPSLADFMGQVGRLGGGLARAETVILGFLSPVERRDFARDWNPKLVVRLTQELYGGDDACYDLYGFLPEHIHGEGWYLRERVLLDPELLPKKVKLCLVTGRSAAETRLALKAARLTQRFPETNWVTRDDQKDRRDGGALLFLLERCPFFNALYVGDTLDHLNSVEDYRERKGGGRARISTAISVWSPTAEAHRQQFLEAGAEVVTPDVNALLAFLKAARG